MTDDRPDQQSGPEARPTGARRFGLDPIALTAGILTVATSVYLLLGGTLTAQRMLAFGAVAVGVLMLASALRRH
ncbi:MULTISPECIES: hypothetical protein [unclassified Actinopolyspora]|uniref:hypothetical protein n=1 Tax=unclassified Actinopolyspora TaxID=2639451 RepID=UPI0013F63C89|nr:MULTISPECIES: hypothetical protein [unclassified Actinopolyspora]NHD16701.1 hypothetical protein [Actinopolyspora sp. BKK2]NHE75436.1 hypothetical protein [Actinopolyspora sp. BKK1]